ncbi:MFS transporter [Paenibacillus profundus]|uniref:MFS transporter n=1 Tax=Paenibacillus profundus TaxID=1173085 RepID=A0ABS8YQU2_9BACL|nr:MFS transporter [Paenibacillus profundus]MCE5172672.1 MFS transporter [Paenibacillus profundus]
MTKQALPHYRNFHVLYAGTFIVTMGSQIYSFILPLFIYEWSQSAIAMSTMRVMDFLPNVLLGMLAGAMVDRINRRKMMKWTSMLQAALASILVLSIWLDALHLWQLYLFGFLLSTLSYTFGNAKHAIVPQLFPREMLTDIQARFSLLGTVLSIIGPSIAGFLIIWLAYEWLFFIYVISLILLWLTVFLIDPVPSPEWKTGQTLWQDMKEGIAELFGNQTLLPPTLTILFTNFATSLVIGVLVFYAVDGLGSSPQEVGWMFSVSAFGGIAGAKGLKMLRKKWKRGAIFHAMLCVDALVLCLFFFAAHWWQLAILLACRTCTTVIINIIYLAIRQESTPNHLLGRVAGTSSMFMKLVLPLGLLLSGLWAEHLPIPCLFLISSAVVAFLAIYLAKGSFRSAA